MKPQPTVALSADYAGVRPLPAELTLMATPVRSTRAGHGLKLARRAALIRPASDEVDVAHRPGGAEGSGQKIDPIGDPMRGLGLTDRR